MKAIVQDAYGPVGVLELREIDRPAPDDDQVLLRVHAAGVGPDVWHLMTGRPYMARLAFGIRRPRQRVRGWDVAGTVEAVGAKVTDLKPGDEVFGVCAGSFAEYACAKPGKLARKPGNLTFEQAAALPISGSTALQALRDHGRVRAGRKVLIIGASGGVGCLAVQIAAAHQAHVTAVCGPSGADLVRSLGAAEVIDYTRSELTGRHDIILDIAGNRPLSLLRGVLAPGGTVVFVGGEEGGPVTGGMGRQLRAAALGPLVRQRFRTFVAKEHRADLEALKDLAEDGRLTPVIDRGFPLAEAPDAIRHLRDGHPRGKVVLTVQ